jgi:UDP:flavonoid glycosyltransferase YjiC (YdhE family)
MRILFAFAGGYGHAAPMVPLARAAPVARGHDVAFTGRASAMRELAFETLPSGSDPQLQLGQGA